jgi:hypothetical protein
MFTKEDFVQMEEHGLTPAALETQLKNFREGFPFLPVTRAASCGDGIRVLDAAGIEQAAARYDRAKESLRVVKFVPAMLTKKQKLIRAANMILTCVAVCG